MAKMRVTGRFYVFLLLLAAIIVFIVQRTTNGGSGEFAAIYADSATDVRRASAIIVRDESVFSQTQVSRVEYVATEHTLVNVGDPVAYVYSLEYSERLVRELSEVRSNIQSYHKTVLGREIDSGLEVLDLTVKQRALDLKSLVKRTANGNFQKLVSQLEEAMEARRSYMSSNMRSDARLIKYYDEERQKINTISSWRKLESAPMSGVVSFYMDGYESALTVDSLKDLSIAQVRTVLAGQPLSTGNTSRASTDVFRIVDQNKWYLVVLSNDDGWNPVIGLSYSFQVVGYEDLVYSGTVVRVQKTGDTVMTQIEVADPIGPLIYSRSGEVVLGTNISGLSVPSRAIDKINGKTGVWLYDVPGGTFIEVEVLSNDGKTAIILPLREGVLSQGLRVLIK